MSACSILSTPRTSLSCSLFHPQLPAPVFVENRKRYHHQYQPPPSADPVLDPMEKSSSDWFLVVVSQGYREGAFFDPNTDLRPSG